MLSVELGHLATILDSTGKGRNISALAKQWSSRIHDSIWENTIVDNIFAYETNGEWVCWCSGYSLTISCKGYGARYIMDDANVPVSQFRIFNFSSRLRPILYYSPCYPFRILDSCVKTIQPT